MNIYKSLYINLILRVLLLTFTCMALAYTWFSLGDWLIDFNIMALIVVQVVLLVRYLNRTNRQLANFFLSIENDDTSLKINDKFKNKSFSKLVRALETVNDKIRLLRMEVVHQYQYLKAVMEHVSIGIIAIDETGHVEMHNRAAGKLFSIGQITHIEQLNRIKPGLSHDILRLGPGNEALINLKGTEGVLQLAIKSSEYKFRLHSIKLISFQNIKNELEEREFESWQKLIRVLTHEIMNSVGPITSSIDTINEILTEEQNASQGNVSVSPNVIDDTLKGINIIKERSLGLSEFVNNFRSLTLLPEPRPNMLKVSQLFDEIHYLFKETLESHHVQVKKSVYPSNLEITADKKMIEQVIINLFTNAIHAVGNCPHPTIQLTSYLSPEQKPVIEITDNGTGIREQDLEKVFIPFYTTRKDGSGIGLSLARQIMRLHKGKISVRSVFGEGTTLFLGF
ncbi:MAG: sensor histidine kinase [Bacteroidales bacterium]